MVCELLIDPFLHIHDGFRDLINDKVLVIFLLVHIYLFRLNHHDIFELRVLFLDINQVNVVHNNTDLLFVLKQEFLFHHDSERGAHDCNQHVHEQQLDD
jgi:hypothetical protein